MANQSNPSMVRPPPLIDNETFKREAVITCCAFYVQIAFLAVFGNGLVVASFIRYSRLRTITNYFVVSLAVADILDLLNINTVEFGLCEISRLWNKFPFLFG